MTKDTALAIKNVSCVPRKSSGSAFPQFALTLRPMCNYLNEKFFFKREMIPQGLTYNLLSCRPRYSLKEKKNLPFTVEDATKWK